jgi:hypothetical protein
VSVERSFIQTWWPVILPLLAVLGSTVRADTRLEGQTERVNYLYNNGSPAVTQRLARMEGTQEAMKAQLDRIERKLDSQSK